MILSAQTIRKMRLVSPMVEKVIFHGMSFGLSAAGYDVRVEFEKDVYEKFLSPGEFILASTIEKFHMQNDVMGIVHDKSSLARRGLAVQNTVIEPGWSGYLTLELTNHGKNILHLVTGTPIAQVVFHRLDRPTEIPYSGKYQNQPRGPQEYILEK